MTPSVSRQCVVCGMVSKIVSPNNNFETIKIGLL